MNLFREYMLIGGMPEVVRRFAESGNYSGTLDIQRQLLADYEEDITKYAIVTRDCSWHHSTRRARPTFA